VRRQAQYFECDRLAEEVDRVLWLLRHERAVLLVNHGKIDVRQLALVAQLPHRHHQRQLQD